MLDPQLPFGGLFLICLHVFGSVTLHAPCVEEGPGGGLIVNNPNRESTYVGTIGAEGTVLSAKDSIRQANQTQVARDSLLMSGCQAALPTCSCQAENAQSRLLMESWGWLVSHTEKQ